MAETPVPNERVTARMALFTTTDSGRTIEFSNLAYEGEDGFALIYLTAKLEDSDYSITKTFSLTPEITDDILDIIGADMQRMMNLADQAEQIDALGPLGEFTGGEEEP